MEIGFCTQFTDENIDFARRAGLAWLELEGSRKYSALLQASPEQYARRVALLKQTGVKVAGIIFASNYLSEDPAEATEAAALFYDLLEHCVALGGDLLTCVTGRDETLSLDDNVRKMVDVFGPMVQAAAARGVRVAFENCPGWKTFATSPENLAKIFTALDTPNLGLEFDPSHFVWQSIDYLAALHEFKDKIFRVHAKDTQISADKLKRTGINGQGWWTYRLPGYGTIEWNRVFQLLREANYDGKVMIEQEDPFFGGDRYYEGVRISARYLSQYIW